MFEMYLQDRHFYEHEHMRNHPMLNGKAFGGKRWMPDSDKLPKGYRPSDYKRKPRGRSPQETQYKRKPETQENDRAAYLLRESGRSYQEIADLLGYSCRQVAHAAVKRGYRDHVLAGNLPANATETDAPARSRTSVPLDLTYAGKPAVRAGKRACGCWVGKGDRVIVIKGKQHCAECALDLKVNTGRSSPKSAPSSRPLLKTDLRP
jgi:hypothetical protein